jgi:hypothetical protein
MPAVVELAIAEMRRAHPSWGPRRLVFELAKRKLEPVASESAVYRCLLRLNLIEPPSPWSRSAHRRIAPNQGVDA